MVPYACDTATFGPGDPERFVDVIGYGRQLAEHAQAVEQAYNAPSSPRMFYHTGYFSSIRVSDHRAQRAVFWKILKRSRVALAYDTLAANTRGFTFSLVAQRWFECLTAGCVIVGKRPVCPETESLLDWEDATIEAPDDASLLVPFLEDLFQSPERLNAIHARNKRETMLRHDWRHRIDQMLGILDLPRPDRLTASIEALRETAHQQ
jgi:hypothetical protein